MGNHSVRLFAIVALTGGFVSAPLAGGATWDGAQLSGVPRVIDGDTIELDGRRVRLFGIDAPELNQTCRDARGSAWDCGGCARDMLSALSSAGLTCVQDDIDRYDRIVATCHSGSRDVNREMVLKGAAFAYTEYSVRYVPQENSAEAAGRGVWSGEAERPSAARREEDLAANTLQLAQAPEGCAIKGNISEGGHIYHVEGQEHYAKTRINEVRGERWFCSEDEAQAAGWRRAIK